MDDEKKQKNDEGDKNVQSESVQEVSKNILTEMVHSEPFSNHIINRFSTEGQRNPEKKAEENGTAKRPSFESADQDLIETNILENEPVSKRLKLTIVERTKENDSKSPRGPVGEDSVDGSSCTVGETIEGVERSPCSDGFVSKALFVPEGDNPQEIHVEMEHSQDDSAIHRASTSSAQDDETSVSCKISGTVNVSKCKTRQRVFSTYPALQKHIQETHLKQPKEHANPQRASKSDYTPSLKMHIKQAHRQHGLYFCDLCGFQSFEENLLHAHFLGKTHLRRQNLAARGGFVKMLTKKSFHKKQQFPLKEKNARVKSTVNKPQIRNTYSNQLRTSNNKAKNVKTSSQLFVEVIPSKNISRENINNEKVFVCNPDGNRDVQAEQHILGSSDCNPDVFEPLKGNQETISNLNTTGMFDSFQQKRNALARRITFKQSGSFRRNQQIKRRYQMLGIGKRSKSDSGLKHSTGKECSQDDLSQVSLKEMEGDVNPLFTAASEKQEHNPYGTDACSVALDLDSSPKKTPDVQKPLHPCILCGCSLQSPKGWALVVDQEHEEELKFHCQACGCSYTCREDFEEYCQKRSQHMGGFKMNCCRCSFLAPNYISLGKHMRDKHSMSHYCITCLLYFLTQDEMAAHNTTKQHISLSQENLFQSPNSEVAMQTASCTAVESSTIPKVVYDIEVKSSVVHPGNEFKESILSKTQFQCKKCFYKTRSSSVLTRHIKLRHAQEYHFLCKACNLYSLSKEGMEKHIKRSKHLENARKNNIGLRFEECIERVCVGTSDSKKITEPSVYGNLKSESENESINVPFCTLQNVSVNKELFPSDESVKGSDLILDSAPKRGRPKGTISRTCPHCGLLASSVTNLTVHIRRKHSHQYSYLCKVCNYYTVTKGDMERHCATKKHKGRLEANGKQNVEIIVCPEGGSVEVNSKKVTSPVSVLSEPVDHRNQSSHLDISVLESQEDDQDSVIQLQTENVLQLHELDRNQCSAEIKQHRIVEIGSVNQDGDSLTQTRPANINENQCDYCNFVAHSFSSLEVHVKRKHTKEFEYYCMACDYYAVTCREMIRHAATEKHKIKRQSYTCTSGEETDAADIAKENAITSQEHQPMEDFQIVLDETKYKNNVEEENVRKQETLKVEKLPNSASKDSATSKGCKEDHVLDAINIELEGEANQSRENIHGEGLKKTVQKDVVVKLDEIIAFKQTIGCVLQESVDSRATVNPSCDFTTETGTKSLAFGKESLNLNFTNNRNKLEDDTEKEFGSTEVPAEEVKAEETHLTELSETCSTAEEQTINESTERAMQNMHILHEEKGFHEGSIIDEEDSLIDAQHEAEVSVHTVWSADGSTIEGVQESSNEAMNNFSSTYRRVKEGTIVQSCGQFDSSIVKLKGHEEGCEPTDHFVEGQNLSGLKVYDLAVKVEASQSRGSKKKVEGNPLRESTRIRCDDCGFLADGLSGLNVHITMKHPSKEKHFHCLLCGKSFYTESNLHQHLASAGHMRNEEASVEELPEGGTTFKCVKCTEPFDSEQNLFLHIKEQHEELLREVNKYIVEDTEQINREREENKGNICKYCGKMCRSSHSMAFLAHIRTHTGSKPFKCKICHFATAQLGDARNHVKRHLGMREYKCHVCGVAFVMKKHLNTHLLGKHGVGTPKERKFTCHLCDRSFTEKWALNNHMKLHTGEKPYKCTWPTCHYSFLTASAMKDHYRTHTGEKSFLCDLCGFAGGTRHALTKHRRQHTGEKPFKCDECNFASTTQSHLTRHKRVHTGEKPYRCPWCDYRSNCAENIRKHILHTGKHEGVKMYNCPKCEYGTNIPVEFRNHLKELHPDIENPDLAYLHAGIVSKSYECRLKGQGATFVETTSPFTTAALGEISPIKEKALQSDRRQPPSTEQVQQVIIIQGYDSDFAIDASVEETAAATLQTLAMAGQMARVVHITEDGQVIATSQNGSHVSSMIPGQILTEQLPDGKTQVVVVEGSLGGTDIGDAVSIETVSDSSNAMVQQIMRQEILDPSEVTRLHPPESASALDALLCAVTELGEVENKAGLLDRAQLGHKDALQISNPEAHIVSSDNIVQETQILPDIQGTDEERKPTEVVTQVVHPSAIIASQERTQVTFKKMVEGVLQFAVCDRAAADQLIKEGVTQVILNEEGTVHMVAREGSQIIMQESGSNTLSVQSEHMDLVGPDGEISQIIVTEEIAQAMVRDSNASFSEGATHYIVTGLPQQLEDESGVYSHTVIDTDEPQEILQAGTLVNSNNMSSDGSDEHLASMVIYTAEGSQTAVIQGQRNSNELQEE
ncbi:zinc finger protein 407 [Eublepharis macularius]|uniref:Zinc finger protein 407 n=1 Tax=Eublepharis macularius TaxID=481883 RepID=A0AA97JNK9_EUBMA|nr:zinc finger protein 407 [Eublepharis macularius]